MIFILKKKIDLDYLHLIKKIDDLHLEKKIDFIDLHLKKKIDFIDLHLIKKIDFIGLHLRKKIDFIVFYFIFKFSSSVEGAGDVLPHGEPEGEDGGQGSRLSALKVCTFIISQLVIYK